MVSECITRKAAAKKSWWTEEAVEFAVLAAIRLLKAPCLLPTCIVSVPSKTAPSLQDFATLCKCSHSLRFAALLHCLRLSWAAYSLAPTPCRQLCSTARVRALEGGPPLSLLARDASCGMAAASVTKQYRTTSSGFSPLPFHFTCQFKDLLSLTVLPRWKNYLYFICTKK